MHALAALEDAGLTGRTLMTVGCPAELELARERGLGPADLSYDGTCTASTEFAVLARHAQIHVALESLSAIERLGTMAPGREVGLRITPDEQLDELDRALRLAGACRLAVRGLQVDVEWDDLADLDAALTDLGPVLDHVGHLDWIALGLPGEDVEAWAALLAEHLQGRVSEVVVEEAIAA